MQPTKNQNFLIAKSLQFHRLNTLKRGTKTFVSYSQWTRFCDDVNINDVYQPSNGIISAGFYQSDELSKIKTIIFFRFDGNNFFVTFSNLLTDSKR